MPAGAHRNQQKKIDSNNIATVFRKGNAITKLLTDAIQKENAGETGVYYWKKKEARNLFSGSGVQFPGVDVQDGLIHSILKMIPLSTGNLWIRPKRSSSSAGLGTARWWTRKGSRWWCTMGQKTILRYLTHGKPIMETFQRDTVSLQTKRTDMRIAHRIMQTGIKMVM